MLNSAANALRTLEYLVDCNEAGVSDIGRHLGVTVGTAHRLVMTLVEVEFAEQNLDTRRYRPSSKLLTLAQQMRSRVSPSARIHLHLVELMQTVRETVHLGVLDDQLVIFVDKATSEQPFTIEIRVGSSLPVYATPMGLVLAAFEDRADPRAFLKAGKTAGFDVPTPPLKQFERELTAVRADGVAEGDCLYLPGIYSVSAPVRGESGSVIAAVEISAPKSRFGSARRDLQSEVRRCAERITEELHQLGLNHVR